jgi:hypothetical protein
MPCARCGTHGPRPIIASLGVWVVAGCLPAGDPPLGQHIIADRTVAAVFLTASEVEGGPPNLFVLGPTRQIEPSGVPVADLYAFPYATLPTTIEGLADVPPTVAGIALGDAAEPAAYIPHTDSRGRLIFVTPVGSDAAAYVARFDFATGQKQDLAPAGGFVLSQKHTRMFAGTSVFELDGATDLGALSAATPAFIGEDLYYGLLSDAVLAGGSSINRSKPGAASETLLSATGIVSFLPIPSDPRSQLLVSSVSDAGEVPFLVLDTVRLVSLTLPPQRGQAQFQSASSNGHWLMFREPLPEGDNRLFLFDWTTGDHVSGSLAERVISDQNEWRPGRDQLWLAFSPRGVAVWDPGVRQLREDLDRVPIQLTFLPDHRDSMFTRDGSHWLSVEFPVTGDVVVPAIYLGPTDDLAAPRQELNPQGQEMRALWETRDGRLLVGASSFNKDRQDIYLVDPVAGTSRGIASGGHVVALGHTRALALLNWQISSSTGDLTLVDFATGAKTLLAQDVYDVAIDSGTSADLSPGADPLAPGTVVAFLTRNRLNSPYDGLWVGHLP